MSKLNVFASKNDTTQDLFDSFTPTILKKSFTLISLGTSTLGTLTLAGGELPDPVSVIAGTIALYGTQTLFNATFGGEQLNTRGKVFDRGLTKELAYKEIKKSEMEFHPIRKRSVLFSSTALNFKAVLNAEFNFFKNITKRPSTTLDAPEHHYNQWSNKEVNTLHLAALLGLDNSPNALKVKALDAMKDPNVVAVFDNALDITEALSYNINNLKKFVEHLELSVGDDARYLFSKANNMPKCIEELTKVVNKALIATNTKQKENNVRHFLNNLNIQLLIAHANGTLDDSLIKNSIAKLDELSPIVRHGLYPEQITQYEGSGVITPSDPLHMVPKKMESAVIFRAKLLDELTKGVFPTTPLPNLDDRSTGINSLTAAKLFTDTFGEEFPFHLDEKREFVSSLSSKLLNEINANTTFIESIPAKRREEFSREIRDNILRRTALSLSSEHDISKVVDDNKPKSAKEDIRLAKRLEKDMDECYAFTSEKLFLR